MKTNPLTQGSISSKLSGLGTVNWEMVKNRASEIALINRRPDNQIQEEDWEEAVSELTGGTELGTPEVERLSEADASKEETGYESPSEDTDMEGHSVSARLVEQGILEAEHDTMLQAAMSKIPQPNSKPNAKE